MSRWKCPMCGAVVKIRTAISTLEDGAQVCSKCWHRTRGRKTMPWSEFQRLCVVNSPKVPLAQIGEQRKRWVGFGLVDEGPAEGNEVLITP